MLSSAYSVMHNCVSFLRMQFPHVNVYPKPEQVSTRLTGSQTLSLVRKDETAPGRALSGMGIKLTH
jgi:hypothetical protein